MGRVLPFIIIGLVMIYAVIEVAQADGDRVRFMPKWMWAVAVICLPLVGALAWFLAGRPLPADPTGQPVKPPRAPDDDTDFLRSL